MKKCCSIVLSALFAFFLVSTFNLSADPGDDPIVIIIEEEGDPNEDPLRSPTPVPIVCYFYPSLSSIVSVFQYSLGNVTVEIENETTGAYSSQIINGTIGAHVIPIANMSGLYSITFTLYDGTTYYGEFEVQ